MSYLETYIAVVDPFSNAPFLITQTAPQAFQWTSKPSRIYDVEWSVDLSSNFITVASLQYPDHEFTDMINQESPIGFYRLLISTE